MLGISNILFYSLLELNIHDIISKKLLNNEILLMHLALHYFKKTTTHKTIILFLFVCLSHIALGYEFKPIYALAVFLLLLAIDK